MIAGLNNYGYWFADGFRFKEHTSQEFFVQVVWTGMPLSPALSVNYDFNLGSGLYVTLGGSHELKLSEDISMELGGLIGFNSRQYIDRTGFSDIDLYARLPLTLGRLMLTPALNVMIPLLDEVNGETEVWFGFSAAF
jgi:hypothetical protein